MNIGDGQLTAKPRRSGLTMALDPGLPTRLFEDFLDSLSDLVDFVKFGWGTALATPDIRTKIAIAQDHDVVPMLGGSFLERAWVDNQLSWAFRYISNDLGLETLEVSNGTVEMEGADKRALIRELAADFQVISEVGMKDSQKSPEMAPALWIDNMMKDLEAGASFVVAEARESGRSGICRENGDLRIGLVTEILLSPVPNEKIIWETPTSALQATMLLRGGQDTNLGNISMFDLVSVATLRLGLRSDTMRGVRLAKPKSVDDLPSRNPYPRLE